MGGDQVSTGPQPLNDVFKHTEEKMQKALEATRIEFTSIRTGRATPALLDRIHCDAYGASVPLKQVATVTAPDARTLQIVAFDRATVGAIRKAIETSDLGLSPNVDGQTIRLGIPPLNEERRRDLVKIVHKKAEDGRVAVRNVRHKTIDEIKVLHRDHKITDDDQKRATDQIQKITDRYIKDLDGILATKEKEIMEV
jgi:ribosome recycling factor